MKGFPRKGSLADTTQEKGKDVVAQGGDGRKVPAIPLLRIPSSSSSSSFLS